MIKIKNYIFNENEIREIKQCKNYLRLDLTYSGPYLHIDDATFEDIEWNYEDKQVRNALESLYREEELENRIKELEEENKKLKENRDKAIEYIEQHLFKWYDTNGIEHIEPRELEDNTDAGFLLKILKGEENENF